MVISILMVIVGVVADGAAADRAVPRTSRRRRSSCQATYVGADALTVEQSVATPIEQQMSGVRQHDLHVLDQRQQRARCTLRVDFDVSTDAEHRPDPGADALLAGGVAAAAATCERTASPSRSRRPARWCCSRSTRRRAPTTRTFLTNYAYININDPMTRVPGVGQVAIFGAGQYAMRFWVRPDTLAKLGITVTEILDAIQKQNTVNPAGQIGGEPVPAGPGVHLHGARAGAADRRRRSSATSSCAPTPTARSCACGTWRASSSARRTTT